MFKFLQKDNYLGKLKRMSSEDLLKEYVNIRTRGSLLCAVGDVKHKDVENWATCEDYLTKTKNIDFELLNDYATICNSLNSVKIDKDKKSKLIEERELVKKKLLEVM